MKVKSALIFTGGTAFGFTAAVVGVPITAYRFVDKVTMRYPEDDQRRIRWEATKTELRQEWGKLVAATKAAWRTEPEVKLTIVK